MFKRLSSVTFKSDSEQLSEVDELDPTLRLDSTCLILVQNVAFWIHFSLKRITYKQKPPCEERNFLRTDSVYEINGIISSFIA